MNSIHQIFLLSKFRINLVPFITNLVKLGIELFERPLELNVLNIGINVWMVDLFNGMILFINNFWIGVSFNGYPFTRLFALSIIILSNQWLLGINKVLKLTFIWFCIFWWGDANYLHHLYLLARYYLGQRLLAVICEGFSL